ncbi:hypothetical protein PF001_g15876 [Phytophthora fragariae]|uniref:Uncharacterized protein n=1 Tax=Phytophthora fragariae TaxID=53985 RepID=A0A6A4CYK1_9STRA|nr:hypothetical protein PF001_g15876 [Phytophthora fragariae]
MKGAECIQTAYCGFTDGYCSSTTLACTTRVEKNQQFAVKCPYSARQRKERAKNHTNRLVKGLFSTTSRRPAAKYRVMEADTSCWTTYL